MATETVLTSIGPLRYQEGKAWRQRLSDFWWRTSVTWRLWWQRRVVFAAVLFLALNAADGFLTNRAHGMAMEYGITIEANPFLAPIAGHWALLLKGIVGVAAIVTLGTLRGFSGRTMCRMLLFGSFVFLGITGWNLYALEMMA